MQPKPAWEAAESGEVLVRPTVPEDAPPLYHEVWLSH